jgi:hypothetical protein
MNRRRLTLIEVLQPQCFQTTPERSRVTRTIVQPEIDSFEQTEAQSEALAGAAEKSALAGRRSGTRNAHLTPPPTPHLAAQLVGA